MLGKCAYFFEETEEGRGGAGGAVTYLLGGHGSGKTVILARLVHELCGLDEGETEDSNATSEEDLRCVSICTFVLARYMYFFFVPASISLHSNAAGEELRFTSTNAKQVPFY